MLELVLDLQYFTNRNHNAQFLSPAGPPTWFFLTGRPPNSSYDMLMRLKQMLPTLSISATLVRAYFCGFCSLDLCLFSVLLSCPPPSLVLPLRFLPLQSTLSGPSDYLICSCYYIDRTCTMHFIGSTRCTSRDVSTALSSMNCI